MGRKDKVIIVGAGIGGLATAVELAARGVQVEVVERAATPGGKMREVAIGDARIDAGPTVFTMRWVFDELFGNAGTSLDAELVLKQADLIARHAWNDHDRLDLFADIQQSADAVARFSGADEGKRFLNFCTDSRKIYETLRGPFIGSSRTNPIGLTGRIGRAGLSGMLHVKPYSTLWQALSGHFRDARLRQLYGRYATYAGSSPFLAPATLMLIAHVEQEGVWLIEGGMHQLAVAMARLAQRNGASIRYGADVAEVLMKNDRACGIRLAGHEDQRIEADAVVLNTDVSALGAGLLGAGVARAAPPTLPKHRSLSAITWNLVAKTSGFPLTRHSVFFSSDYPAEFDDIFKRGRPPLEPTVYICAQDRGASLSELHPQPQNAAAGERLLLLINAPANGDSRQADAAEIERWRLRTFNVLERCGLHIEHRPDATQATTASGFEQLFPATGGALYGRASHGWQASFARPGSRTKVPRLYLAGGSTHPGAGVPMAALSGRQAATSVLADLAREARKR
jgi:1-hydroxycarotenoid 3,4-desaturase